MGFGVAAAGAVFALGVLIVTSVLVQGIFHAQQDVQNGLTKAQSRLEVARQGVVRVDNATYDAVAQQLRVNVTNTGSVTFNTTLLDLVVDGEVKTANITARKVNDVTTNVWPPGTRLEIFASLTAAPTNLVVVTSAGVKGFWRA